MHCDKPITVGALRAKILSSIEDLILYLMSPVGEGLLQGKDTSHDASSKYALQQQHTKSADQETNFELPLDDSKCLRKLPESIILRDKEAVSAGNHNRRMWSGLPSVLNIPGQVHDMARPNKRLEDMGQVLDEAKAKNEDDPPGPAHRLTHISHDAAQNMNQTGMQVGPSPTPSSREDDQIFSSLERLKLTQVDREPSASMENGMHKRTNQQNSDEQRQNRTDPVVNQFDASTNGVIHSPFRSPENAPWSSIYNSSHSTSFQSPQHLQHVSHLAPQFFPQAYASHMTQAQLQYLAFQQIQQGGHRPNNFSFYQTNQQQLQPVFQPSPQLSGGTYGPNGVWIPNDRYVRPPATNRIAPLFAQSGAWQTNQPRQTPGVVQHPEWQNRFASPASAVSCDNRKLAYLEGSDEMYPQPPLGGGASVRFQSLTRNQPPGLDVVTDEKNVPFLETARASKPAQWGVMKIGNVSHKF